MPSNVVILKAVSNSILTAPQFLQELTALKAADSKARSKAAKQRAVQKKQELRQLSLEASADWNRVLNRISNSILGAMLERRSPRGYITANCLLGNYGIEQYRSNEPGLLEKALRAEKLLSKWFNGSYVNRRYSLKDFVKNEYQTGKFNDLYVPSGGRRGRDRTIRYYDVSTSQMATVNKKRNTFVHAILSEVESILSSSGYTVKNTVKLTKWSDTKSTVYYTGSLSFTAQ